MIKLFIQGLKDGSYEIDQKADCKSIPDISEEFFGDVTIRGSLRRIGSRYTFKGSACCMAKFICDRSLQEYNEQICADFEVNAIHNTTLARTKDKDLAENEKILGIEDKYIDITEDVREELAVSLPMKRVSPEYANKDFDEFFPEYSAKLNKRMKKQRNETDDRWKELQKLKIDRN